MQPIPTIKEQGQAKEIYTTFHAWSSFLKMGDYAGMEALCIPNSEFAEISNMCKRGGNIGIRFYYEFENLKVISLKNEGSEAIIKGEIKLIQSGSGITFEGQFLSSCQLYSSDHCLPRLAFPYSSDHCLPRLPVRSGLTNVPCWKLGDIDIEWED